MPEFFAAVEVVEGEHVGDAGLAGADDGLADEDGTHAETLEDGDLSGVEHGGFFLERGEGLGLIGAELEDAGGAVGRVGWDCGLGEDGEALEEGAFDSDEGHAGAGAEFL